MKLPLYARAGISEVWLVDLTRRVVDVHRKPENGSYTEVVTRRAGDRVALALMPEIDVALALTFG